MLPESMVKTRLSLDPGKYTQPPNIVLVPADRKRFPIRVRIAMESRETYVLGTPDRQHVHQWCVLDAKLNQVMRGEVRHGRPVGKSAESFVARTVMGGGASNPDDFAIELSAAKLKHGAAYTLLCTLFGSIAGLAFTAVRQPKAKPRKKAAGKRKPKKAAKRKPKKAAAKPKAKKAAAKRKPKRAARAKKKGKSAA